ncbi:MAG TPA: class I mannose-6-phosphate isomerase [Jatrophihabitans sp.]
MKPVVLSPNLPETFYRGSGRLSTFRHQELPPRPEDWVASTTARFGRAPAGLTVLEDGSLLANAIEADPQAWLGSSAADTGLLVKLLDAGQRLPVHVHPNRSFARAHFASKYGKTEAWIVLDAAPDAIVHLGFARDIDRTELSEWVAKQDTAAMLEATNRIPVAAGDALLCPAGMPHAIGADVLLVELQEPTDFSVLLEWEGFPLTREDAMLGMPMDQAIDCVDRRACTPERLRSLYTPAPHSLLPAEAADFFRAEALASGVLTADFSVLIGTSGRGELSGDWGAMTFGHGSTILVPHAAGDCSVSGDVAGIRCRKALLAA